MAAESQSTLGVGSSSGSASRATEWIAVGGLATTSESLVEPRTPPPSTSVFSIKRWSASGSGVVRVLGEAKLFIENFFLLLLAGGMANLANLLPRLGRRVSESEQDARCTA